MSWDQHDIGLEYEDCLSHLKKPLNSDQYVITDLEGFIENKTKTEVK